MNTLRTVVGFICVFGLSGCLGEPEIEERWTRIDLQTPQPSSPITPGTAVPITVAGEIVYRSIITGSIVAEVRVSTTIPTGSTILDPDVSRLELLDTVDHILVNSVSAGFGVIPFTGWDHLIQDINIPFTADIPAPGSGTVFLLLYLADADEIELPTGEEVIVIDPFDHTAMEAFPVAIELIPEAAAP